MALPSDDVKKKALVALTEALVAQGHPAEYAQYMAMSSIFQADLDLRNAQLSGLLTWVQTQHSSLYPQAIQVVEGIRAEFENRIQQQS